jgi:hypothetical protein
MVLKNQHVLDRIVREIPLSSQSVYHPQTQGSRGMVPGSPGVVPLRNMFEGMCCAPIQVRVAGVQDRVQVWWLCRTGAHVRACCRARMFALACGVRGCRALSRALSRSLCLARSLALSRALARSLLSLSLSLSPTL